MTLDTQIPRSTQFQLIFIIRALWIVTTHTGHDHSCTGISDFFTNRVRELSLCFVTYGTCFTPAELKHGELA